MPDIRKIAPSAYTTSFIISPIKQLFSTGLTMYIDANNLLSYSGSGTSWIDLSGNNYTNTINSAPFVTLDGLKGFNTSTTGVILGNSSFSYGPSHTMIAIARMLPDSTVTTWRTLWRTSPDDHPLLVQDSTNAIGYYDNNSGAFISFGLNAGTIGLESKWAMYSLVSNGSSTTLYINDGSISGSVSYTANGLSYDAFGNISPGSQPFGWVSVGMMYRTTALTVGQINQNYQYFKSIYPNIM